LTTAGAARWGSRNWALPISVALHAFLLLVLIVQHSTDTQNGPSPESIPVEVWTGQQFEAFSQPKILDTHEPQPPPPAKAESSAPLETHESAQPSRDAGPAPLKLPKTSGVVHAKTILSGKVLADPRSKEARDTLALVEEDTRLEQLCDLEAMAQIAQWHQGARPDRVVAYATADPETKGRVFIAKGAAVHTDRNWYSLTFRCELGPSRRTVQAFEFAIGDAIPRRDWERDNLPAEDRARRNPGVLD
jgi:hypothetical protein